MKWEGALRKSNIRLDLHPRAKLVGNQHDNRYFPKITWASTMLPKSECLLQRQGVGGGSRGAGNMSTRRRIRSVYSNGVQSSQELKTAQCSSRGERLKILWHLHVMKRHSAIKANQRLIQPTAESISKHYAERRSPTQKNTHCVIQRLWSSRTDKTNQWWQRKKER